MRMIFSTPQGAVEDDFEADKPLRVLKAAVLDKLNLPAAWVDQYIVACDDNTLEEGKTLEELGLPENTTLVVWRVSRSSARRPQT